MEGGGLASQWRQCIDVKPFDFDKAVSTKPRGHVVAVRVTSESPDDGFKPTSGRVQELGFRSKPDVWAYFSIKVRTSTARVFMLGLQHVGVENKLNGHSLRHNVCANSDGRIV